MGLDLRGVEQRLYDLGLCQGANTVPCTSKPPSSSCATISWATKPLAPVTHTLSGTARAREGARTTAGTVGRRSSTCSPGTVYSRRFTGTALISDRGQRIRRNDEGGLGPCGAKGGVVLVLARLGRAHRRSTFRRAAALQARAARPASQRRPGRACAPAGEQTHWGTHAEQDRGVPGFQLHAPTVSGSPAGGCGGKAGSPVHESGTN
jgi:hypothetical protein